MSKVILHIGLHKTGTSFLQHNVFPFLENTFYAHNNEFFVPWKIQLDNRADNMLLSYEGFSGFPWNKASELSKSHHHQSYLESFQLNIEQLKKFFPQAVIIVFFRKQGDLLLSLYKQFLHEGGKLKMNDFYGGNGIIQEEDLSIKARMIYLKENFNTVYCLNYEEFLKKGTSYVMHFFREELDMNLREVKNQSLKNISVAGEKMEVLRRYNTLYTSFPRMLKKILVVSGLDPRNLVQRRLSFWKTKDSNLYKELKDNINNHFTDDWNYFINNQWKMKNPVTSD